MEKSFCVKMYERHKGMSAEQLEKYYEEIEKELKNTNRRNTKDGRTH